MGNWITIYREETHNSGLFSPAESVGKNTVKAEDGQI